MKNLLLLFLLVIAGKSFSQSKNYIDQPYLETVASVDTLVIPDRIYLSITITEKDTKGKISVEELETQMFQKLKSVGVNIEKQLFLSDLSSNFKKYFIKPQDILKSKSYSLVIYEAQTAGLVMVELENLGIANVDLERTEYSKMEELKIQLKSKAVLKGKKQAEVMVSSLNQKLGAAIFISDIEQPFVSKVSAVQIRQSVYSKPSIPTVEFEKIRVRSEISIKFRIE